MRSRQLLSLLAAMVLLAACETAGGGSGDEGGAGGQSAQSGQSSQGGQAGGQEAMNVMLERVGDRIFFDYDKSDLKPAARNTIQGWANWLKTNPGGNFTVEGHADERGTREYNLALGERRAVAVKNYLVALGVGSGRVRTISYGKERPLDPGHNTAAWAQNRRGVLKSR
jgi:peptidoglycan-associated lipoprotein